MLIAALDAPSYLWLGPVGIVVATVVVRWVMAGVLVLLRAIVAQTVKSSGPPNPNHGRRSR